LKQPEPDYEVLIIGGGIHGAGVFQAAAAAGMRALLLERTQLAAGTSSRSSKLIHGGLRYLENFQLRLVRESLAERKLLLANAPELVRLVPFHVPVYSSTTRPPWMLRAGLSLYAVLGGLTRAARFESLPRAEWGALDGLVTRDLRAVFRYFDGQTDDALLTRAVAASGVALGGEVRVPALFHAARRVGPHWAVEWREGAAQGERRATAATLVNAAGPWIEGVRARIHPEPPGPAIDLVGGTHIELPGRLERGIYYVEAQDRRAVFAMPFGERTLVGTTEQPYRGDPALVRPTAEEVEYLRDVFRGHFPGRSAEVLESWAGLRVLPRAEGAAFSRSRETLLVTDDDEVPRHVAIYGGKLTGYRATAERVLRLLGRTLPPREPLADTRFLRLVRPAT
jgi:glycerol-3-phosphate dehydrogenase